jgi:hypothetical protein
MRQRERPPKSGATAKVAAPVVSAPRGASHEHDREREDAQDDDTDGCRKHAVDPQAQALALPGASENWLMK